MMRRRSFLSGFLCGAMAMLLVVGGGRLITRSIAVTDAQQLRRAPSGNDHPRGLTVPQHSYGNTVPPNWERHEFNGGWFYIVPLAQR